MSKTNDGGPAFPEFRPVFDKDGRITGYREQKSLTARDYFAAKALAGMLANPVITEHPAFDRQGLADSAGDYADAMLVEREKEG